MVLVAHSYGGSMPFRGSDVDLPGGLVTLAQAAPVLRVEKALAWPREPPSEWTARRNSLTSVGTSRRSHLRSEI
jgi:hypothetical protein